MKDTETYIKEVYEKAKTMPEMEEIPMDEINSVDLDEYPEVHFSKRHERKMQKLFKLARKIDARNYRTERREIRKKISEKKRLKKLKYSDKKNKPSSK